MTLWPMVIFAVLGVLNELVNGDEVSFIRGKLERMKGEK